MGSGAKNLASAGKSGLSHLNDIRKNGFGHRKDITHDNGEEQSDDKATTVPNSKKTVSEMFGKAKMVFLKPQKVLVTSMNVG